MQRKQFQVDCDKTKLLIIVMTAPANFRDRCFKLIEWDVTKKKLKKNISRQLIRMTWGSTFQLEMVKGKLVFVVGTFDDDHLQRKAIS